MDTVLLVIGILLALGGSLVTLVRAFQTSVAWGVFSLLIPVVGLIFYFCHWDRARRSFFCSVVGAFLIAAGVLLGGWDPDKMSFSDAVTQMLKIDDSPSAETLTTQIQEQRSKIEALEGKVHVQGAELAKQFQALDKRRKALKSEDVAGIQSFNVEAEAYTAQNKAHKAVAVELDSARKDLQRLLDERSTQRANSGSASVAAAGSNGAAKEIIMYTTASCPACVAAKSYMARKGIRYEERDVERSSAALAEFQNLGGRGVPLILVGNEKMVGFSAQKLEEMIGS